MRKIVFILILTFQILGIATVFSQTGRIECPSLTDLKPKSILLLAPHNDRISYKENSEFNAVRAETVKNIFMPF